MDPLADKFMVFGALLSILYRFADIRPVFIWAAAIVMFRELAVTSIRLVACGQEGLVIAASWHCNCTFGACSSAIHSLPGMAHSLLYNHRSNDHYDRLVRRRLSASLLEVYQTK